MDAFRLLACFVFRDFCSVSPFRLYEEVPGLDFEFEQQSLKAKSASNLKHAHSLEWNNNTITKSFRKHRHRYVRADHCQPKRLLRELYPDHQLSLIHI